MLPNLRWTKLGVRLTIMASTRLHDYDLRCNACGKEWAIQATMDEDKERPCYLSECNGTLVVVIRNAPGVVWNAGGATRGYGPSKGAPRLDPSRNTGHNPPTVAELGLSAQDCADIGIK